MPVDVECVVCGKKEKVPPSRAKKYKTCSMECLSEYFKADYNVECKLCSKPFHLKPSHILKDGNFCSRECLAKYQSDNFKGENNHQYGLKGPLNSSFKGYITKRNNHKNIDLYNGA